jgi:hypothetical protein
MISVQVSNYIGYSASTMVIVQVSSYSGECATT